MYPVLICWSPETIEACLDVFKFTYGPVVSWAYDEGETNPQFVSSELLVHYLQTG